MFYINPNTFTRVVGKVQKTNKQTKKKTLSPKGGKKGGWRKKTRATRPQGPGLEPGTYRVLGTGVV